MNNPPYQPYGGPPLQQTHMSRTNAFRNAPLSGSGGPAFARSGQPSTGSMNAPHQQQMGTGPRSLAPPNRSFSFDPSSQPMAPSSQQLSNHPVPMSDGGYGPPHGKLV
ncbi:unnamed protein product [Peronospora destructor]|uniref:Uncharacterized protein n=1 Tax=Peronospora destructor TaxID=86335 RepID=A0AAV0V2M4_9STRA|nr:unnamed protein product [Peronospora destructor]